MRKKTEKGLTLIEVILGITISVVILGILFSALRLGHRSQEKGIEREEVSQRMRILADRLTWLLSGAYPYKREVEEEERLYFSGTTRSAGFVTTSIDPYSEELQDIAGLKWVTLFVDEAEGLKIREKIYFDEDVFEDSGGREYVFDPTVKDIEFEYLDINEETGEEIWLSAWAEDKDYLPYAVKASLVFIYKEKEVYMPPVVVLLRAGGQ
jgi:hypothetical protein